MKTGLNSRVLPAVVTMGHVALAVLIAACAGALPARAQSAGAGATRGMSKVIQGGGAGGNQAGFSGTGTIIGVGGGKMGTLVTQSVATEEAVLVELRDTPLARGLRGRSLAGARQALADQRGRVAAAIAQMRSGMRQSDVMRREYSVVFHGFAARLPKELHERIRALPDVRAVHADVVLHTTLEQSVPLVNAPAVWSGTGYRGAGRRIAVVDTGVDYTHADLGGCFGSSCKVVGGYDFVNNDADPIDDNGHGTHVASTAAGRRGTLDGVAPDASILAYKVCDSHGSCPTSAILAGIEKAVDPNGDGTAADHADVINLSLGGGGNADDPIAQAVDGASAAGVVVVAAAGNAGPTAFSVGSPGAARTAVTVGATDKSDQLAAFSSRGPTTNTVYGLKPELTAPGVDICAAQAAGTSLGGACLDSAHVKLSGTSMATPHVAGAAALLRGLNPTLTPAEIKSLLVNNSVDLGLPVNSQGAGRLDVAAAAAARTVVTPSAVSFGADDGTQAVFTGSTTLTVRNLDAVPRSYTLSSAALPGGITVAFAPASFTLAAGQSISVSFSLSVDNAVVPNLAEAPYAYQGQVLIDSSGQRQRLPFDFLKASYLRIRTDQPARFIAYRNGSSGGGQLGNGTDTVFDLFVGAGLLDVFVNFEGHPQPWVVREGVVVNGNAEITVNKSEAIYPVDFYSRDQNGQVLTASNQGVDLLHRATGMHFMKLGNDPGDMGPQYLFSPVSSAYNLHLATLSQSGSAFYFVSGGSNSGVSSALSLGNTAAGLTRSTLQYFARPDQANLGWYDYLEMNLGPNAAVAIGLGRNDSAVFTHDLYVSKTPFASFPLSYRKEFHLANGVSVHSSGQIQGAQTAGTANVFNFFDVTTPVYSTATGELPLNFGPAYWFKRFDNAANAISLHGAIGGGWWAFMSQGGDGPEALEATPRAVPWSLLSGSTVVSSGTLQQSNFGGAGGDLYIAPPASGPYTFVSDGPLYYAGSLSGQAHVRADFDLTRADPNPPTITKLALRSGGRLTNRVGSTAGAVLQFDVSDASAVSVSVSYGQPAVAATVTATGAHSYQASLPSCQAGGVPLTIRAVDAAGNALQEDFAPGFECVPALAANTASLNVGSVQLQPCTTGSSTPCGSRTAAVTISNPGSSAASITAAGISGGNGVFTTPAIAAGAPITVPAGGSVGVSVTFTPTTVGSATARLDLSTSTGPLSVALSGTGTAPNSAYLQQTSPAAPGTLAYGNVLTGTTASTTAVIKNVGLASGTISSVTVGGTDASAFKVATTFPKTVAANGGTQSIAVNFTPSARRAYSAYLTVKISGDPTHPTLTIPLAGTGVAPVNTVAPASLAFGNQARGSTSAAKSVTVSNTGDAPLVIRSAVLSGLYAGQYKVSTATSAPCPIAASGSSPSLAPGASCLIDVRFAPTSGGSKGGVTLQVNVVAPAARQTVSLGGTGI